MRHKRFDEAYSGHVFIASQEDYETARAVIFGMPMDFTSSFRPGARFGPGRIREVSVVLEEYSPMLERELKELCYFDAGDMPLPFGNAEKSVEMIGSYIRELLADGKFPLGLGGEHLVSWPVIREMYQKYPDLVLFHIDAHADLRSDYEGEMLSHATPVRRALELMGGKNIYQFGIRSGTREEFQLARETLNFYPFDVLAPMQAVLQDVGERPVYVSVDIDVLDPAYAPGTGTPEPGGISASELFAAVAAISRAGTHVVGADVVEVAPAYDVSERTAVAAAKLVREILLGWVNNFELP